MVDKNGIEINCKNCLYFKGKSCLVKLAQNKCENSSFFTADKKSYETRIAELQKELDYKKQNELEILEIIKTQESFESLYDKYSGTTEEDALGALEKCAEEADRIINNLLFELHVVKDSEKVEAYEADNMRIKNEELKLKIRNLQGKIRYLENMIRYNSRNNSDNKTQIKQK